MPGFYLYTSKESIYEMVPYIEGTIADSTGIVTYCKTTEEVEEDLLFMVSDSIMSQDNFTTAVLSELKKLQNFPKVYYTVQKIASSHMAQVVFAVLSGRSL